MRFMMLVIPKGYENAAPGSMPDAKAVAVMMKYNESLRNAGVLLALDGLHPPSMGARVSFPGGKPKVTDGPFSEAKEVLGGYWMIQVKSKEEAIEWATRCPASENEVIEVRQVQEFADFPADVKEAAAGFAEMQAQSGHRKTRFLTIYKAVETNAPPSPEEMAAMGKLIEDGMKAGFLLAAEGCLHSSKGARIRLSNGKLTVTDGPFTESKEVVGGFAILQAQSKQEAIEHCRNFLKVAGDGESELRELYEVPALGPA